MRKIISQMLVSIDGFIEGPHKELDWHQVDEEYHEYAAELLHSVDAIVYGRKTYEHMRAFWPTAQASERFPVIAERMNHLPKIVVTSTLQEADWNDTRLIHNQVEEQLLVLKQQPGRDIVILASSELVASLADRGLIDEFQIIINPVVLGGGKPFLQAVNKRLPMRLLKSRVFRSGNVLLYYEPVKPVK